MIIVIDYAGIVNDSYDDMMMIQTMMMIEENVFSIIHCCSNISHNVFIGKKVLLLTKLLFYAAIFNVFGGFAHLFVIVISNVVVLV